MDNKAFYHAARQLAAHADGYAALGMDATNAATWANHGFYPGEALPWLSAGFATGDAAAPFANEFMSPTAALAALAA